MFVVVVLCGSVCLWHARLLKKCVQIDHIDPLYCIFESRLDLRDITRAVLWHQHSTFWSRLFGSFRSYPSPTTGFVDGFKTITGNVVQRLQTIQVALVFLCLVNCLLFSSILLQLTRDVVCVCGRSLAQAPLN